MTAPGDIIGRYEVVESRGSGGMGAVWEAEDGADNRVALKLMHAHHADEPDLVRRFQREYEVGRALRHPNLVAMLDYGVAGQVPYLVMELVPGKSLRRLIERGGPFREWEVATMGAQLADAIGALGAHGIVHRDLKASNVMVDRELRAVIIDYGIARVEGERTIGDGGGFIGSAEYSSPEPYLGRQVTARSDVYSLGIVLYEALTGRVPFRSDRYTDTLRMHAELAVPRVSEQLPLISADMDNLICAMLQKQPERRPTAEQVAAACRSIARFNGREIGPAPAPAAVMPGAGLPPVPPMPVRAYGSGPGTRTGAGRGSSFVPFVFGALAALAVVITLVVAAASS